MKKYLITSLFVIIASFALIACGGSSKAEEGAIYVNVGSEPKTIDPIKNASVDGAIYSFHFFEGLATRDKNNNVVPGVAEKWDVSSDGLTYTFYLREDAKWSDGKPVVAGDFVYSWQYAVDPMTAAEYSYQFEPVKNAIAITAGKMPKEKLGVEAVNDRTLKVTLEAPTAYFLELAAFPTFFPLRKDVVENNVDAWTLTPETFIVNGPYKMTERKTDDKIVAEINENYWNKSSLVAKKIVFVLMENATAAVAGIKSGNLHFNNNPPNEDLPKLVKEGIAEIVPYLGTYYYVVNNTNEITKDPKVRRALSLAIDRNYIVEEVTKGGQLPATAFVPYGISDVDGDFREKGGDYYSVKKEDFAKNIEEAKKLLAEAGYPDGKGLPVIEFKSNPGNHIKIFEAVQQMWKENLNIDSTLIQEEWAVFQNSRLNKDFVIARHGWIGDYNDPLTFMAVLLSYSSLNNGGFKSAEYDKQLQIAMKSGDQKVRMEAMHKAEDVLMNNMGLIPLYFYTNPIIRNPKLKGVVYDPLGMYKFYYATVEK